MSVTKLNPTRLDTNSDSKLDIFKERQGKMKSRSITNTQRVQKHRFSLEERRQEYRDKGFCRKFTERTTVNLYKVAYIFAGACSIACGTLYILSKNCNKDTASNTQATANPNSINETVARADGQLAEIVYPVFIDQFCQLFEELAIVFFFLAVTVSVLTTFIAACPSKADCFRKAWVECNIGNNKYSKLSTDDTSDIEAGPSDEETSSNEAGPSNEETSGKVAGPSNEETSGKEAGPSDEHTSDKKAVQPPLIYHESTF